MQKEQKQSQKESMRSKFWRIGGEGKKYNFLGGGRNGVWKIYTVDPCVQVQVHAQVLHFFVHVHVHAHIHVRVMFMFTLH
jgi:hypothetical protein